MKSSHGVLRNACTAIRSSAIQAVSTRRTVQRTSVTIVIAALLLFAPASNLGAASAPPTLIVAANIYEPFVFVRNGQLAGFDVDLVNLIASLNGWTVTYQTMTFPAELLSIQSGSVDLGIGSVFKTTDRVSRFAFTDAYMNSGLILVTPTDSTLRSSRDLSGHRVAVKTGTTSDDYVTNLDNQGATIEAERYVSPEEVISAVAEGQADAAVHDFINAQYLVNKRYLGTLVLQRGSLFRPFLNGSQPVAYPAARNMLPLLSQFNATLAEVRHSGMLAQLETKWFGSTISSYAGGEWIKTAMLVAGILALVLLTVYYLISREHATRAARERAAYYQQLFSAVPEPALLVRNVDAQPEVEAVNGALCALLHREEKSLLGTPINSFIVSGQADALTTLTGLEEQSIGSTTLQLVASDGTLVPVEVMMSSLQNPAKRLLIIARDLRDQLKAEKTIRAAYEQYHALFDEAPDATLILTDHVITQANHATMRTLATTPQKLLGRTVAEISPVLQPDGRSSTQAMRELEEQSLAGASQRFDWVLVASDGHQVICEASLQSIPSAGPAVLQEIFRDVTDQRLMEERSQQLERELLQSQKMEAVGRLAGGIAHDFNNIMGGIMGHASLLKVDAMEGTDLYEGLNTIELAARRAASLTRRLLSFSRKDTLTVTDIDVGQVLGDTLTIAMPGFDQRTILVQNLVPDLAYVAGDQTQLEEVFLNLIINARDAMKPKGGTLTITACNLTIDELFCLTHSMVVLPDGNYIQITVTDTGHGLTPEAKDHLFEPFFTTKPDGTGLGLSIVWRIVHDHNGTITVSSEPGNGTTFTLYLPAIPRAEAQKRVRQASISESLPRSAGGETILVVDDEDVVRSVAVKVLGGLGYHVIDRANPRDALDVYEHSWRSIDLILIDMMMPHMNGKELFDKLREINPLAMAILMSGYDATDTPLAASGFVAFIPKPYTLQELATRVYQSLSTPATRPSGIGDESSV